MVLTLREALDFLLAEQGGVCAMINSSCCIYINTSKEVEEQTARILQQAAWLKGRASHSLSQKFGSRLGENAIPKKLVGPFSWPSVYTLLITHLRPLPV